VATTSRKTERATPREELRRSTAGFLALLGDVFLRGPLPRALLLIVVVVLELTLAATIKSRILRGRGCAVLPSAVTLGTLPEFVPADVAADLRRPRDVAIRSVADAALEDDLRAAYEEHPWVRRVSTVRRVFPSRAVVEIELRRPFAWVEVERWRLTVDAEGVVLDDRASRAPAGLPAIRANSKAAPGIPRIGGVFSSLAVKRGLALLRELRARLSDRSRRDVGGRRGGGRRLVARPSLRRAGRMGRAHRRRPARGRAADL
jgi:hypothetical protein